MILRSRYPVYLSSPKNRLFTSPTINSATLRACVSTDIKFNSETHFTIHNCCQMNIIFARIQIWRVPLEQYVESERPIIIVRYVTVSYTMRIITAVGPVTEIVHELIVLQNGTDGRKIVRIILYICISSDNTILFWLSFSLVARVKKFEVTYY